MYRSLYKYLPVIIVIFLCLLAALVTVKNLGWEKSFAGEDYGVWYDFPRRALYPVIFTWDNFFAPGKLNVTSMFSTIWGSTMYMLDALRLTPIFVSRMMYWLFLSLSGVGMYVLFRLLMRLHVRQASEWGVQLGAITASLFYMFNHFTMEIASIPISPYHLSYMLLPLTFVLFITNIQVASHGSTIALFVASFIILAGGNPSNTITIVLLMFAYFIFFYQRRQTHNTRPWLFLGISLILIMLATSYIYLPMLNIKGNPYGNIDVGRELFASVRFNSQFTSFSNLFLLGGAVTWPNYTYYNTYTKDLTFLVLGYGITILSLVPLLLPFGKKLKVFLGFVIIFSLFFAKGTFPPFENIFMGIFSAFPMVVGMYRNVYNKFIYFTAFAMSILLGIFVAQAWGYIPRDLKHIGRLVLFCVPFLICFYSWPFFAGIMIQYSNGDVLTVIPKEYRQADEYLKNDPRNFKVLAVPPAPRGAGLILQWEGNNRYVGFHPDRIFLNRPTVDSYWYLDKGLFGLTESNSWTGNEFENQFADVLDYALIHNIRYIFLHKDFVESYSFGGTGISIIEGKLKSKTIMDVLSKISDVEQIVDTAFYRIYKLPDRYFTPHIYVPKSYIFDDGEFRHLSDLLGFVHVKKPWAVYQTDSRRDNRFDEIADPLVDDIFVQAKLRHTVVPEELNKDKLYAQLPVPTVNWSPEHPLYKYVKLREWYDVVRTATDKRLTIEKYLGLVRKRMAELVRYPSIKEESFRSVSDEVMRELSAVHRILKSMSIGTDTDASVYLNKYFLIIWESQDILNSRTFVPQSGAILKKIFADQEKKAEELRPKRDVNASLFEVNIPKSGQYELYIKNELGKLFLFETREFVKGNQSFSLPFEKVEPYIKTTSVDGSNIEHAIFRLTFEYQATAPLHFTILDRKSDVIMAEMDMPGTAGEWRQYELFLFSPYKIYHPEISSNLSHVRNESVERVYDATILLRLLQPTQSTIHQTPHIAFQKINQTKYLVDIKDAKEPFWLILSESFHVNWKAYILNEPSDTGSEGGKRVIQTYADGAITEREHKNIFFDSHSFETIGRTPLSESKHFVVNGYANGWYIAPQDANLNEFRVIIEFYPQRYFYIGLGLAALTVIVLIVVICSGVIGLLRRRKHE